MESIELGMGTQMESFFFFFFSLKDTKMELWEKRISGVRPTWLEFQTCHLLVCGSGQTI